jgi:hypothetical protein
VLVPWRDEVQAVLLVYFGGQRMGHAIVLLGRELQRLSVGSSESDLMTSARMNARAAHAGRSTGRA